MSNVIQVVGMTLISLALFVLLGAWLDHRMPILRRRKREVTPWTAPETLTDEDHTWLDYMSRQDLEGWVAYISRPQVEKARDSLPGAAVERERKVDAIDPDDAVGRIEAIISRGRGHISSHDVIAATRGERMKIVSRNLDGSCVLELKRRGGGVAYLQATRELMMQITGRGAPGALVKGLCKFHAWTTEPVFAENAPVARTSKTTCIDCGADYNNPREWNGGW